MRIRQAREENQIQFLENLFRILKFSPAITTNQVKLKSAKFIKDEVYDIFYQKRKSSKNRLLEKRLEENYISNPEKVDDEEALQRQCREKIIFTIEMIKNCIFSQNVVIEIKIILAKTFEIIASNYPSICSNAVEDTNELKMIMNVIITSLEVIKYTGVNGDDSVFREEMSAFQEESKESTENFGDSQSEYLIENKTKTNFTPQHLTPHKKAELKKSITSKNIEDEESNFLSDSESKEDEKPQESVKYSSENNITLLSHDSAQFSQTLMSNISRFNKSERNNLAMIESKITGALLLINSLMNVYFNPEIEDSSVNANLKKEAVFDILFDVILQTGIYAMYSLQDSFFKRNLKTSF